MAQFSSKPRPLLSNNQLFCRFKNQNKKNWRERHFDKVKTENKLESRHDYVCLVDSIMTTHDRKLCVSRRYKDTYAGTLFPTPYHYLNLWLKLERREFVQVEDDDQTSFSSYQNLSIMYLCNCLQCAGTEIWFVECWLPNRTSNRGRVLADLVNSCFNTYDKFSMPFFVLLKKKAIYIYSMKAC